MLYIKKEEILNRVFKCIDYSPDKTRENLCKEFNLKMEDYFKSY
jgi:hypothetical protein